jgi:hypothetical protein
VTKNTPGSQDREFYSWCANEIERQFKFLCSQHEFKRTERIVRVSWCSVVFKRDDAKVWLGCSVDERPYGTLVVGGHPYYFQALLKRLSPSPALPEEPIYEGHNVAKHIAISKRDYRQVLKVYSTMLHDHIEEFIGSIEMEWAAKRKIKSTPRTSHPRATRRRRGQ